jgi:hypothetical protein
LLKAAIAVSGMPAGHTCEHSPTSEHGATARATWRTRRPVAPRSLTAAPSDTLDALGAEIRDRAEAVDRHEQIQFGEYSA